MTRCFPLRLDDSPSQWFANYLSSPRRNYLQLRPGQHVFIHYRTYLTFDAWRFQYYRQGRRSLEPLKSLARSCLPSEVYSWRKRFFRNPVKLLDLDLGPGFQLVCDSHDAERLATVWTVRIRTSAITLADFDDDNQVWSWRLAEPPPWEETSSNDLYCGYQLIPVTGPRQSAGMSGS
jgi:hypothetical protein